ncbi:helix-turn-helix transcriptional regulator [Methylorubrum thiocyanatum]|uniref:helix-turn-helix transcriptional regulator n=1 Tax=Methylorubrum thiocyanatum TaxID=47958 RepID=UPI00383B9CDB
MSTRHFCRAFRTAMGLSPYDYIVQRRVERARALIQESRLSFSEIAVNVGFSNHAHMTSTFQRVLGKTPSQFRA